MAGYLGTKAVLLSTTAASVGGDATIGGDLTVDTDTLHVDSTNNRVGIGTSSPSNQLSLYNSGTGQYDHIEFYNSYGSTVGYIFSANTSTGIRNTAGGNTGEGIVLEGLSNELKFYTDGSEAARFDSSGNLLVGKTTSSGSVEGAELRANGRVFATADSTEPVFINRLSSDGSLVTFRKDGSEVGSIGVASSDNLYIECLTSNHSGLAFGEDSMVPRRNGNYADNAVDLGSASTRFDDVYATNGTIQTSDRNEKQDIASLTDAEITAAKAISKLFKTFKWNDSVAEKGDAARTHSGVIAQDVEQAMTDAGLNAGDYAFFISTTWWETQTDVPAVEADEENGVEAQEAYTRTDTYETAEEAPEGATERNRKGIRYPQLLSFIGAATEQRLASIESRLDALESA